MNMFENSKKLFDRAKKVLVGGVNSPVRAFKNVGGTPLFIRRAKGAYIWDEDGNKYIDYVCSWGPLILGHANDKVVEAIKATALNGTTFGAPTELETRLAEMVGDIYPSMERMRFVNSGTEAAMSAIRVARGFTRRTKIIKFEGCYHGHSDYLLVKAGSGALTHSVPDSAGVPGEFTSHTLVAKYNDISSVEGLFEQNKGQIACVIVEPVAGNMGCVLPRSGFLVELRRLCDRHEALLIFDEVMTGFRVALGGAQERYDVKPDMTCLGKVLGGGLPVGAYGGRGEIMKLLAPEGEVYQAGTLSGNPIAMAAGIETLKQITVPGFYDYLETLVARLAEGLETAAAKSGVSCCVNYVGTMWSLFFSKKDVESFDDVMASDRGMFVRYFRAMLSEGIYLAPSPYEAGFMSSAHTEDDIDATVDAAGRVFRGGCPKTLVLSSL